MNSRTRTQNMVLASVLAAVMAVLSPFSIPAVGAVPFTLGIFCAVLVGGMLPPALALSSLTVYMLLGFIGMPVFSNFGAGPQVLFGPTGGYLLGYYLLVLAVSLSGKYTKKISLRLLCSFAGMAVCYLFGTLWYMVYAKVSFIAALFYCVVPFVLYDIVKIAGALLLSVALTARLQKGRRTA